MNRRGFTIHQQSVPRVLASMGVLHKRSTPQSNGKAEATVKAMKKIIRAAWKGRFLDKTALCQALIQYRNVQGWIIVNSKAVWTPHTGHALCLPMSVCVRVATQQKRQKGELSNHKRQPKKVQFTAHSLPDITTGTHVTIQNTRTKL